MNNAQNAHERVDGMLAEILSRYPASKVNRLVRPIPNMPSSKLRLSPAWTGFRVGAGKSTRPARAGDGRNASCPPPAAKALSDATKAPRQVARGACRSVVPGGPPYWTTFRHPAVAFRVFPRRIAKNPIDRTL